MASKTVHILAAALLLQACADTRPLTARTSDQLLSIINRDEPECVKAFREHSCLVPKGSGWLMCDQVVIPGPEQYRLGPVITRQECEPKFTKWWTDKTNAIAAVLAIYPLPTCVEPFRGRITREMYLDNRINPDAPTAFQRLVVTGGLHLPDPACAAAVCAYQRYLTHEAPSCAG